MTEQHLKRRLGQLKGGLTMAQRATEAAEAVRCFIEPLAEQGCTLQQIADWLNARRVRTPGNVEWRTCSVWTTMKRLGLTPARARGARLHAA